MRECVPFACVPMLADNENAKNNKSLELEAGDEGAAELM